MPLTEDGYRPSDIAGHGHRFIVVTGCSSGGKSSLLAELALRGHHVFAEAGREVVKEQDWTGGDALPWTEPVKFAELAVSRALHQLTRACATEGLCFFDRSPVDLFAGLSRSGLRVPPTIAGAVRMCRFNETVFIAPPWPEIYRRDAERRHGIEEALAEYGPLTATYRRLGYRLVELPRVDVIARADFVLAQLGA